MANPIIAFRKRLFLSPITTDLTSYIYAVVESSRDGEYPWGTNMLTIADCRRRIQLEFFLGTASERRLSQQKLDLLINVLSDFRAALTKEIAAIEKGEN